MPPHRHQLLIPALLLLAAAAVFLTLGIERQAFSRVAGDEGTYLAMAESLVLDRDLAFGEADAARLRAVAEPGRQAVILHRAGDGAFHYSKPSLYAVAASPFYALGGGAGLVALNALALAAALLCAWRYLAAFGARRAAWTLATFAGAAAVLPYVAWRMSDAFQFACAVAGLALSLGALPRRGFETGRPLPYAGRWAALAGGLLLGLAAAMRITNLALAVVPPLALALERRWRRGALAAVGVLLALALGLGLDAALLGTSSPYRATRATFDAAGGFPVGDDAADAEKRLKTALAQVRLQKVRPRLVAYAALYSVIGRHSGLLLYFPAALLFAGWALRRPDRTSLAVLLGAGALFAAYLVRLPHNYFGGGACVGNRYFLVSYAGLLFAMSGLPRRRWLAPVWLLAAAVALSAFVSVRASHEVEASSQNHAYAGLFRRLPYESTANNIEGARERFWPFASTDEPWELVRFADPWSRVGGWSFQLASDRPPAEIEIANRRPGGPLRFLVLSRARRLELVYEDWGKRRVFQLDRPVAERGLVEIETSPPWRRHPFWFWWAIDEVFTARTFRLSIRTPDGRPADAELRYLGLESLPDDLFASTPLRAELPATAVAGSRLAVPLRIRNDSSAPWSSAGVLPVFLSYRIFGPGRRLAAEGERTLLAEPVAPGESFARTIEVVWPADAGSYRLEVDLVLEGVAWFGQRSDGPLAAAEVVVTPPR